jgi:hypothetical protein|tara:strand:+ start:53 stop:562 length:510 start_codon:yes stop_codon:yes gene_type:complete
MNKKIVGIASVSIASLLVVLIVSENSELKLIDTIEVPVLTMPTDDEKSEMSQTFLVEAKYKPSRGIISIFYEDKSKMTDKLIIEIWGLPQTYHKEFECDVDALAANAEHENVCPDFVTATIKINSAPKYGWESIPVVFTVDHNQFGKISIKTEIYETGDPQPRVIFSTI